jgi:hypothetical protein
MSLQLSPSDYRFILAKWRQIVNRLIDARLGTTSRLV